MCVYVCICIYIYIHIHIYTYIYTYIHIYIYIYIHTYTYIHIHIYIYIYTHTHIHIYIFFFLFFFFYTDIRCGNTSFKQPIEHGQFMTDSITNYTYVSQLCFQCATASGWWDHSGQSCHLKPEPDPDSAPAAPSAAADVRISERSDPAVSDPGEREGGQRESAEVGTDVRFMV